MQIKRALFLGLSVWSLAISGCGQLLTAYLVRELLDEGAPKRNWSGIVKDSGGDPVEGVKVEVRAAAAGDDNVLVFDDGTDVDGRYSINFRWNENITYTLRVLDADQTLVEQYIGKISLGDQTTDLVVQSAAGASISGVIRDVDGNPVAGALVLVGSVPQEGDQPDMFTDGQGNTAYDLSGESGIYKLDGAVAVSAVVCAFHPDHGFAYATGADEDGNGEIALDLAMGNNGDFDVSVQVVDGTGEYVSNQVLAPARQFRLRLDTPFNLGSEVDEVVSENDLFTGFAGDPSDLHPGAATLVVQSTGADGLADNSVQVAGGGYRLSLLEIDSSDLPEALVVSPSPFPIGRDSSILVRVN